MFKELSIDKKLVANVNPYYITRAIMFIKEHGIENNHINLIEMKVCPYCDSMVIVNKEKPEWKACCLDIYEPDHAFKMAAYNNNGVLTLMSLEKVKEIYENITL